MSEDQTMKDLKAYKEGFKDGYNEAVKFYIINPRINTRPVNYPLEYDGCPVCGRKGPDAMVCYISNCPSKAYSGAIGAIGSDYFSNLPLGANGPTGGDVK